MARERTVRILTFEELNDDQKKKVIENIRSHVEDDYNYVAGDMVTEFKYNLEQTYGMTDADIAYSGFWSQGDGASFSCKYVDIPKFLNATNQQELLDKLSPHIDEIEANLERIDTRYANSNTVKANVLFMGDNEIEEELGNELNQLEELLDQFQKDESGRIYGELEDTYDHMTSDDSAIEYIHDNELEFNEDTLQIED